VARHVDYDDFQHSVYSQGRGLTAARAEFWARVFSRYLDRSARPAIVDVGSGTGMYSRLLAEHFDAIVTGVDPSVRMREIAERENPHPRVQYVAGTAEHLPLPDASCHVALLSNVIHHVADREAGAAELERVLRPGGLLLLRGTARDDLPGGIPFFDYFPTAIAIDRRRVPSVDEMAELFAGGFLKVAHEPLQQESASSFAEYYERVRTRAISTFELIDDEDFEVGIERMRQVAERETDPKPVYERVDLLVLRRR
jgi:ubiquinone/menaquinone biosynthesis C-methylase UbiE